MSARDCVTAKDHLEAATAGGELHVHLVSKGGMTRLVVVADTRPIKGFCGTDRCLKEPYPALTVV